MKCKSGTDLGFVSGAHGAQKTTGLILISNNAGASQAKGSLEGPSRWQRCVELGWSRCWGQGHHSWRCTTGDRSGLAETITGSSSHMVPLYVAAQNKNKDPCLHSRAST